MKPKACGDCRHWYQSEDPEFGECRCDPPVVVVFEGSIQTHWPKVADDDWCSFFINRASEHL